ncbi:DUF805 domain-containing protein [Hyunsoonleella ulvae]|uniref:DUF805 domain-containing protein n=1 Tax=Hyunsoonleella ulvae TaxID=2799948 RepID=UPI001939A42B|nr:DUF805 domain-containing protein [Hyunsoonleella ulvae]
MNWYLKVVRDNYANFQGRARRQEYWMFTLINILIIFGVALLSGLFVGNDDTAFIPMILIGVYFLAILIPSIAVTVRRLHDTGKSGWYYLLSFIPYVGGIIMLVFTVQNGDVGTNKYGPDPKNPEIDNEIDDIGKPLLDQ